MVRVIDASPDCPIGLLTLVGDRSLTDSYDCRQCRVNVSEELCCKRSKAARSAGRSRWCAALTFGASAPVRRAPNSGRSTGRRQDHTIGGCTFKRTDDLNRPSPRPTQSAGTLSTIGGIAKPNPLSSTGTASPGNPTLPRHREGRVNAVDRSADASITGYTYQFEYSALRILESNDDDTIVIEGIEDLDRHTRSGVELTQCKYLSGSTYSVSALRNPIIPMLRTFQLGHRFQFRLYVHFGGTKQAPTKLTVEEFKTCMIEKKRKDGPKLIDHAKDVDDQTATEFCSLLEIIPAPEFAAQRRQLLRAIQDTMECTATDADEFYHPRFLALIIDLARQSTGSERTVKRSKFLRDVNSKSILFNEWHKEYLGRERLLDKQVKHARRAGSWIPKHRVLILTREIDFSRIVDSLSDRMMPGRRNLHTNIPISVAIAADNEFVSTMKIRAIDAGVIFNDGFESYSFTPWVFNSDAVVNDSSGVITRSSYHLRIASLETLAKYADELNQYHSIISFGVEIPDTLRSRSTFNIDVACSDPDEILEFIGRLK